MLICIACGLCLFLVGCCIFNYLKYEENVKLLFKPDNVLKLDTIILFSNDELACRILNSLKESPRELEIQCSDNYYLLINKDITKDELLSKIDLLQDFMIQKRYDNKNEVLIEDCIDKRIFDIWLDYGYKSNYRSIFKKEMYNLLCSGEISNSTFNEMYRRFYKFNRNGVEFNI